MCGGQKADLARRHRAVLERLPCNRMELGAALDGTHCAADIALAEQQRARAGRDRVLGARAARPAGRRLIRHFFFLLCTARHATKRRVGSRHGAGGDLCAHSFVAVAWPVRDSSVSELFDDVFGQPVGHADRVHAGHVGAYRAPPPTDLVSGVGEKGGGVGGREGARARARADESGLGGAGAHARAGSHVTCPLPARYPALLRVHQRDRSVPRRAYGGMRQPARP